MKKKFNIFIHSPYRSGSTYLFSEFRKNKKINCFYEIYNEEISLKNQNDLSQSFIELIWNGVFLYLYF